MVELIYCSLCGIKCSGKMQVLDKKLNTKPVCSNCFVETEMNTHLEEAKRRIKK